MKQGLGRDQRIRKKREFQFLFDKGKSARGKFLTVWAVERVPAAPAAPQCGVMVSRKVDLRAIGRNLWKRRIREAFRRSQHLFQPRISVLVKAQSGMKTPQYREIEQEMLALLKKLGFLK